MCMIPAIQESVDQYEVCFTWFSFIDILTPQRKGYFSKTGPWKFVMQNQRNMQRNMEPEGLDEEGRTKKEAKQEWGQEGERKQSHLRETVWGGVMMKED